MFAVIISTLINIQVDKTTIVVSLKKDLGVI